MLHFSIGQTTVYAYGLAVMAAAVVSLAVAGLMMKKRDLPKGALSWFALLCMPLSVLCARLGYCLIRFGWFSAKGIGWFFRFSEGGYVLYGALLGGVLAALLTAKIARCSFAKLADALAAPAALMIALCRLAEGLADEGWGWDLDTWFAEDGGMSFFFGGQDPMNWSFFPLAHYREMWDTWYWAIYVLEALVALALFVWLLRSKKLRDGDLALSMALVYAVTQMVMESMRQDSLLRWGFVRAMQVIGAVIIVGVQLYWSLRAPRQGRRAALHFAGTVVCVLVLVAMEFGVEKKIVAIEWFPVIGCHLVMMLACAGLLACILPLRHAALKEEAHA